MRRKKCLLFIIVSFLCTISFAQNITLPPGTNQPVNSLWNEDRLIYHTGFTGQPEDWSLDDSYDVHLDYVITSSNTFTAVYYINYTDWVNMGKPYEVVFYVMHKKTQKYEKKVIWIPVEYNPGGIL